MLPTLHDNSAALDEIQAAINKRGLTWKDVHAGLARASQAAGEWAGYPLPVEGMSMVIHPKYPFSANLSKTFMPESLHVCHEEDVREDQFIRNEWRSYRDGRGITVFQDGPKVRFCYSRRPHSGPLLLHTLKAARSWDVNAEIRALETLRKHVTEWAFECYFMTGSFLETSKRSGVIYLFRRLRPTIALTANPDRKGRDSGVRILACLCMHGIGYFSDSWAGALCPTDDVLSHLFLMRGDEHKFWTWANQHHPLAPEAGL